MTVIQAHWSRFVVHTADVPKITEMWWCDSTFIEKSFKNSKNRNSESEGKIDIFQHFNFNPDT